MTSPGAGEPPPKMSRQIVLLACLVLSAAESARGHTFQSVLSRVFDIVRGPPEKLPKLSKVNQRN